MERTTSAAINPTLLRTPRFRDLSLVAALVALASLLGAAWAQVVVNPQSIVVNPRPSFDVDVSLNKSPQGGQAPLYRIGEEVTISVTVDRAAYVYLFDVRPNGQVTQILPNRLSGGQSNRLQAGETVRFPPRNAAYSFQIDGPQGLSKVIAVASEQQLDTSQLAQFRGGQFASSDIGEEGFADAFSIVVRPVDQNEWVTSTALYYVGSRPQAPAYGTLDIGSDPRGAEVTIDGRFAGYTPLTYPVRPGRHDVELRLDGYRTLSRSVTVGAGARQAFDFDLERVRRTGTVRFESSPSGADVFVGGEYVGTTPTGNVQLDEGSYSASFRRSGYLDTTVDFSVNANQTRSVSAQLRAATGTLVVQANVGGAQVYLDGEFRGSIPSGSGRLELSGLAAGDYELTVLAPGFSTALRTITVNPGRSTTVEVRQSRR